VRNIKAMLRGSSAAGASGATSAKAGAKRMAS